MSERTLTELMAELYRSLTGLDAGCGTLDTIRASVQDNGLDSPPRDWLTNLFDAVLARRTAGPDLFPHDGGDVATFWLEASGVIPGWQLDDQGEWVLMTFPALGMQVRVSREALTPDGHGCCSYVVGPMPA